ncbi:hypothetical protein ATANTOWER_006580 [Ataeniobius toweri]|uniref:Uncharacterized protein n=1 Tax=Ataeniobius toweri TaxID=208326 RepID=A0ABU7B7C1_9TELE|nr:hypothetical protein [Ataeniobius toweri]
MTFPRQEQEVLCSLSLRFSSRFNMASARRHCNESWYREDTWMDYSIRTDCILLCLLPVHPSRCPVLCIQNRNWRLQLEESFV